MKKLFLTFIIILAFTLQAITQNVWENTNTEVHPFLYRMAQKGFIEYNDLIKPINRVSIINALNTLQENDSTLTTLEKQELAFYLQEYSRPLKEQNSLFKKAAKIHGNHFSYTLIESTDIR